MRAALPRFVHPKSIALTRKEDSRTALRKVGPRISAYEPSEGPLNEWLCVFLDADAMSDDQLVEVPRKQLFERSPRQVSISEGQPDVECNAAMRRCNARQFEQSIAKGLTLHYRIDLD